jgi:hypothetical protein
VPKEPPSPVLSPEHQALFDRITAYFSPYGDCAGWIEYWMWDVAQCLRPWPFWLEYSEPLEVDLITLRDQAKVWFAWDFSKRAWQMVRVAVWVEHTKKYGVLEAQDGRAPLPGGIEDKK